MAWIFSEFSRAKRRARRKGKSDGRQSIPSLDWNGGPVPYLETLRAQYLVKINNLQLKRWRIEGQAIRAEEEDFAGKTSTQYQVAQLDNERSLYEEHLNKLLREKTGAPEDNPLSIAPRVRHIPAFVYIVALIFLAVGEYFVTLPATKIILNDDDWQALVITGSFSALSILAAHIVGLTLKIDMDREKPQPPSQKWGALVIFIFLSNVVLLLSAVRSRTVSSVPVKFGLSDKLFGTALFFVIQMSFILCAIALSYFFHSEIESEIRSTKRKVKRLTRKIRRLTKSLNTPGEGNLTPDKKVILGHAIDADMRVLTAEYQEICSVYVAANLRAQKVKFTNPGPGLDGPPLMPVA